MEKKQGIGIFEKYLTIWVAALCIMIGLAVGQYLPAIPRFVRRLFQELETSNIQLGIVCVSLISEW